MDFNELWGIISPYVTDTAVIGAVVAIITAVVKITSSIKLAVNKVRETADANSNPTEILVKAIKSSMPEKLSLDINEVVESYLSNLTNEIKEKLDVDVLGEVETLKEQNKIILASLRCLKSVSDSVKDDITNAIGEKKEQTILTIPLKSITEELEKENVEAVVYTPIE